MDSNKRKCTRCFREFEDLKSLIRHIKKKHKDFVDTRIFKMMESEMSDKSYGHVETDSQLVLKYVNSRKDHKTHTIPVNPEIVEPEIVEPKVESKKESKVEEPKKEDSKKKNLVSDLLGKSETSVSEDALE
jgi:hypothetical protein